MNNEIQIFNAIDNIIKKIEIVKQEPKFSTEFSYRLGKNASSLQLQFDDSKILKLFAELIAYSQNANSMSVTNMLAENTFNRLFNNFDVQIVAGMDSNDWILKNWNLVTVIRFKSKIGRIIKCAEFLNKSKKEFGSFVSMLEEFKIPVYIKNESDIDKFWFGFNKLKKELNIADVPFFKNTTSLLHFLLTIGYDCVKPDIIIMRVSQEIGIVDKLTGDANYIQTVKTIQKYSLIRSIKPSLIDFYFLIYGGQEWAKQFVCKVPEKI